MKTNKLYKLIVPLLFLAGSIGVAWGQEDNPVTGDQYSKPVYNKINVIARVGNTSTTVNQVTDGNVSNYWLSTNESSRSLTISLPTSATTEMKVKRIVVTARGTTVQEGGNANALKPTQIEIQNQASGGQWTTIQTYTTNRAQSVFTIDLNSVLTTWEFRINFTPYSDSTNGVYNIEINEVEVYEALEAEDYANVEIQHKQAKWYNWRNGGTFDDWFSDDEPMFNTEGNELIPDVGEIQASHTFIDTIYVHEGSTVNLTIPDRHNNGTVSTRSYQRWYSFRTDGTFRTKNEDDDAVWDLLTPPSDINMLRYENGYVGGSLVGVDIADEMVFYYPTTEEFNSWFDTSDNAGATGQAQINNHWYIVACDVSGYTDCELNAAGTEFTEPTLTHRILYYIVSVDDRTSDAATETWTNGHGRLTQEAFQGGTNADGKKYLEEYEINYPFTRISNNTAEAVALSKYASNYAIPGANKTDDNSTLHITIVDNTAGIAIQNNDNTISGLNKVISFTYPGTDDATYGTRTVNDEDGDGISQATILVTKQVDETTYNIARFKLTFRQETTLLSQTIISNLDNGTVAEDAPWAGYTERTPSKLQSSYQLLNSINWDYDESITHDGIQEGYYPYPMAWEYSTYSFYDGSNSSNFVGTTMPQWGFYAITDKYISDGSTSTNPSGGTYHLFVDASERQGTITMLPFETNLCRGAELFVSAWVKSAANRAEDEQDAAMLFTILGEDADGNRIPLYRHATGQIPRSDMLSSQIPGCGSGTNQWFQTYFSFINDTEVSYLRYYLEVSNFSASTSGGDMYLDDVRVYIAQPSAEIRQLEGTCGNERTRLNLSTDWDRLLSRTGEPDLAEDEYDSYTNFPKTEDDVPYSAIGLCFIDRWKYEAYLADPTHSDDITGAIDHAATMIGANDGDGTTNNYKYAAMFYKLDYDKNTSYSNGQNKDDGGALAKNNGWFFYYDDSRSITDRALTVDFYADIQPYRPYIMMVVPVDPQENQTIEAIRASLSASSFDDINNNCAIKTEVWVTSESLIKIDGEVIDPQPEYCSGQVLNFSVQLRYPSGVNEDGEQQYTDLTDNVYFDWFFGTSEAFNATDETSGVSLADALAGLREVNQDADETTLGSVTTDATIFTDAMKNLIQSYLTPTAEGLHTPLVLHESSLDITLLPSGLDLVIRPIQMDITTETQGATICWDPIPFHLEPSGEAPELHMGFHDVNYPDGLEPGLRIGLEQIEKATSSTPIKVNLRGADPINDGATLSEQTDNAYIYLIGSNDPNISSMFNDNFDSESLPIGYITNLNATENGNDNNMTIYFDRIGTLTNAEENDFVFNPKEGYYYRLRVPFQEEITTGSTTQNICYGQFSFNMHVVPAYQKWIGTADANWNNDDNWARSSSTELKKQAYSTTNTDGYVDYTDNPTDRTTIGYVPMKFTKVTIPGTTETNAAKQVELYAASKNTTASGTTHEIWDLSSVSGATTNIEYDLMVNPVVSNNAYVCETYYTNTVDEIHFEPNAEMLHAELLDYNKAWVDYKLKSEQWHTLASPLQGVVAGDFYTDQSNGQENSEYFKEINFSSTDNSRISPSVYQRGWKGSGATMVDVGTGDTGERAVAGNWSAVYNNVEEKYEPGTGFSLKVLDMPTGADGNAVFRLPKADETFTYYDANGDATETKSEEIERKNTGKLKISTSDANTEDDVLFTVTNLEANGNYYLIGNPFMAHLNMRTFLDGNKNIVGSAYWFNDEDGVQNIISVSEDDWITTGSDKAPLVPPLHSFFVRKAEDATEPIEVTFTRDMQTLESSTDGTTGNALYLTATTADGKTSRAAIAYDATAKATYEASEDAELFLDSNLSDVPAIYTVAGTMATSINCTSELYNIPVGIYGNSTEMVTLSFEGLNHFSSATLYDAEEKTETPLREGTTLTVPASTSGRYFLRAGTPTANEVIETNDIQIYTLSGNLVMVTSNVPLKDIRVYTMNGAQVKHTKAGVCSFELYLADGIYLITAQNASGETQTEKVVVR